MFMGIRKRNSLIWGVGINDADYVVHQRIDGKSYTCKFYRTWKHMLDRCYSEDYHKRFPTYIGCTVTPEWFSFMKFKIWMQGQDWQGKHLDKDILFPGNKIYSPDTCIFIDVIINSFTTNAAASRGEWPIGVSLRKDLGKFTGCCSNPFTKKNEHLGHFDNPDDAHEAWRRRKHEIACQLAESEHVTDPRVAEALRKRYSPVGYEVCDNDN